jgi:diacylglycerol O-acyltransferase
MATHPMSPVDAAWYHMDGPANLAMVTGVMLTGERFDFERVKSVYQHRILAFDRFRQRVVERGFPVSSPHWEDMPNFDIGQHLHHVALPSPHDRAALTTLLDDIASAPLDHEQPLWQVHVVDDVDGGSALIMRYHHCIGDGTAMMAVIEQLADDAPELQPASTAADESLAEEAPGHGLLAPALDAISRQAAKALALANSAADAVAHPQQLIERAALVLEGAEMVVTELLKRPDPRSPFKGDFGMRKRVAWSHPVALDDIKAIGASAGAKVNDVLVAGMTGALRSYLRQRGVRVNETTVRAMVPVDLRPPHLAGKLGNEFGLVVLDLAVSSPRRMDRLAKTKARMDALKRSPEAAAMLALFSVFGRAPKALEDFATEIFGSKASVVMTNVAGPRKTLYLAGVPIERMMFWVPHPGRQLGMGISILSYKGTATLAVIADAHLVPDPEAITDQFNREFAAMLRQVQAAAAKARAAKPAMRTTVVKAPARKTAARPKAATRPRSTAR